LLRQPSRQPSPCPLPAGRGEMPGLSSLHKSRWLWSLAMGLLPLPEGEGWGEGSCSESGKKSHCAPCRASARPTKAHHAGGGGMLTQARIAEWRPCFVAPCEIAGQARNDEHLFSGQPAMTNTLSGFSPTYKSSSCWRRRHVGTSQNRGMETLFRGSVRDCGSSPQ
jgi:hypothetical protein